MTPHPRIICLLLLATFAWTITATEGNIKQLNHRNPSKFSNDVYEIVGDGWQAEQAGQNADDADQAQKSLDQYTVSPLQTANARLRRGLGKIPGEVPGLISAVIAQPTVGNTIATPIHNTAKNLPTPPPGMRRRGGLEGLDVIAGQGAKTTFITKVSAADERTEKRTEHLESTVTGF
ncbi:hypothetical protein HII31_08276 [Pseudocercospora fuligena]|uniref:Secreted protein n=1 Tax=Pseudocercospora fuligena TaxID=685502 RepID=A0A8H6RG87_9PEZI|nr:hypothetical protein HII31_08276 [Pseudocercospora fuligena]